MVPAGSKAKRLSSVSHTTKTIHDHCLHHHHILRTKDYMHPDCDSDYEILKKLAEGTFSKAKKEKTREKKSVVVKFWKERGKFKVVNGKLYFREREV